MHKLTAKEDLPTFRGSKEDDVSSLVGEFLLVDKVLDPKDVRDKIEIVHS